MVKKTKNNLFINSDKCIKKCREKEEQLNSETEKQKELKIV